MPQLPKDIEVERVKNIVQGWGWEITKQEIVGDDLILTMKKKFLLDGERPATEITT